MCWTAQHSRMKAELASRPMGLNSGIMSAGAWTQTEIDIRSSSTRSEYLRDVDRPLTLEELRTSRFADGESDMLISDASELDDEG